MRLPLRILLILSFTLVFSAIIVRLAWEFASPMSAGSWVVVILLMAAIGGTYVLILYLTIKPSLKKLKSLSVAIFATALATGAIIDVIIHFISFVPSPNASSSLSILIASLLLAASISGYLLALWLIWCFRKGKKV